MSVNNTLLGNYALNSVSTDSSNNTAIGAFSMYSGATIFNNTAVGSNALYYNTQGDNNTAVGAGAMTSALGSLNTAVGSSALEFSDAGSYNTAVGAQALYSSTDCSLNSALGYQAGMHNAGYQNVIMGALSDASGTLHDNVVVGYTAYTKNSDCVIIGSRAYSSGGAYDVVIGNQAFATNGYSTILGAFANTNQANVCAVGYDAICDASNSIVIGASAKINSSATNSISIGNSTVVASSVQNGTVLGTSAQCDASNSIVIGANALINSGAVNGVAVGKSASIASNVENGVAVGYDVVCDASNSIVIGANAIVNSGAVNGVAVGKSASIASNVENGVAVGYDVVCDASNSIVIGANALINSGAVNSIAIGKGASVASNVENGVAIGTNAQCTSSNTVVLGTSSQQVVVPGTLNVTTNALTTVPFRVASSGFGTESVNPTAAIVDEDTNNSIWMIPYAGENAYNGLTETGDSLITTNNLQPITIGPQTTSTTGIRVDMSNVYLSAYAGTLCMNSIMFPNESNAINYNNYMYSDNTNALLFIGGNLSGNLLASPSGVGYTTVGEGQTIRVSDVYGLNAGVYSINVTFCCNPNGSSNPTYVRIISDVPNTYSSTNIYATNGNWIIYSNTVTVTLPEPDSIYVSIYNSSTNNAFWLGNSSSTSASVGTIQITRIA